MNILEDRIIVYSIETVVQLKIMIIMKNNNNKNHQKIIY